MLDIGIYRKIDMITSGAQLAFDKRTVCGGVIEPTNLKQGIYDVIYAVFDKICHIIKLLLRANFKYGDFLCKRRIVFIERDRSGFIHSLQHNIGPRIGDVHFVSAILIETFIGVGTGIRVIGLLNHSRKHGTFTDGQLVKLLAEIILCCGFETVVGVAKVNIVHIRFKNCIL